MTRSNIDLLLSRRSVLAKNLGKPGPNKRELRTILQAGLRVPDHGRSEPWKIQVLDESAQLALGTFSAQLFQRDNPNATAAQITFERERPQRSPILLVVTFQPNKKKLAKIPELEQLLSSGAVCQNLLVAIQALGYNAQWLTDWPAYHPEIRQFLGSGKDAQIVGFIHIGTATLLPKERPRPEFNDIVSEWKPED
jgi:nitroreductase